MTAGTGRERPEPQPDRDERPDQWPRQRREQHRLRRWVGELALGMRMSVVGGSGWSRLLLIATGVGLGVAMLLLAATLPHLSAARDARLDARAVDDARSVAQGDDTLLLTDVNSEYGDHDVNGWLVQPEGAHPPLPPGVTRLPDPGELVVSPALRRLMDSDEGTLLRERWGDRIAGTIGAAGLTGPGEYAFYLGTDRLTEETATRVSSFDAGRPDSGEAAPVLVLLGVVGMVVLLVPVAVFLATAVRFAGEARDRRLAALRLVGADAATTRRIAAGETLAGALLGLVVGALLFVAAGVAGSRLVPAGMSYYLADFRPVPLLAALVVVLVPVAAVLVTLSALRKVIVEPLGVVRRTTGRRRRLWWRLVLPVAGLALLYPLRDGVSQGEAGYEYQIMAGVAALLIGVALLLPWLVQAVVRRLGGGGVAWQLAVRRLQLDSGTAVRAVSGIAVSVAGVIAVQGLLGAVQTQVASDESARDADRFQAVVLPWLDDSKEGWADALRGAPGVEAVATMAQVPATASALADGPAADSTADPVVLQVGECAVLRQLAELDDCAEGDTFVLEQGALTPRPGETYLLGDTGSETGRGTAQDGGPAGGENPGDQNPGDQNTGGEKQGEALTGEPGGAARWTLPRTAEVVPARDNGVYQTDPVILATPAALGDSRPDLSNFRVYVALDPAEPAALDRLRNAAAQVDPSAYVSPVRIDAVETVLADIRQALLVGATALLVLIGASLLVNVAEQLRERRRLLAVLIAFGTRRTSLAGSVLFQIAVPVLLGMALAVATGTALAAILQAAADAPVRLDWSGIGATSGIAALVVLLTTVAGLPLLGRLTRPEGLRSE